MVLTEPVNFRGAILFSTFVPPVGGTCLAGGSAFVSAINFRTGGGIIIDNTVNELGPFYNGGIKDLNSDKGVNVADLDYGVKNGFLEPVLDVHAVTSTADGRYPLQT